MAKIEFYRDGERYEYDTDIRDDEVAGHPVKMTSFHSVVDQRWSIDYIIDIQKTERDSGHEICGAPTKDGTPCSRYPLKLSSEPYPDEIGRCSIHRPSMGDTDISEPVQTSEKSIVAVRSGLPDTQVGRVILDIADQMYMRCGNCISRNECEDRGEDNSRCVQERKILEAVMELMSRENNMDTLADQLTVLSIADTMIKIIRTSSHETRYGILEAISSGTAQYNIYLKKLLYQGLKNLGLDRKTRIIIKHAKGGVEEVGGSIARALSAANITEIEMRSAKMKVDQRQDRDQRTKKGPPIGLDGNVIKDDVTIEQDN